MSKDSFILKLILIAIISCSINKYSSAGYLFAEDKNQPLNFAEGTNWIKQDTSRVKDFDVIFIHPTTYLDLNNPDNDSLNDDAINQQNQTTILRQAMVFSESCNILAPYYRQMSMACLNLPADSQNIYFQKAYQDVEAAINYYLNHLNNNRPFFIAGHSQGSSMIKEYLYQKHDSIAKTNLVAVYAIGYTFTADTIDQIGIALSESASQIPALITWNTIMKGGDSPVINSGATCVNPLTWTTTTDSIGASENAGALINMGNDSIRMSMQWIDQFTGAQINHNGALVISDLDETILNQLDLSMGENVFHSYDYDFFYQNLVENVNLRCETYLSKSDSIIRSCETFK